MEEEIWKEIPSLEGRYEISTLGRYRYTHPTVTYFTRGAECTRQQVCTPKTGALKKNGYLYAMLHKFACRTTINLAVHRLVAEAFIQNPDNKPHVNHKNGIKTDNRAINLEWATAKENVAHSMENNLWDCRGEKCHLSKKVINSTGKIYPTITEAAKSINMKMKTLSAMLRGQSKNKTDFKYLKT